MPPRQGRRLEQAERERVEIVSFPECFLTGYPDTEELVRWDAFAIDSAKLMQVLDATSRFEPVLFVGFDELRGADLYNTALDRRPQPPPRGKFPLRRHRPDHFRPKLERRPLDVERSRVQPAVAIARDSAAVR